MIKKNFFKQALSGQKPVFGLWQGLVDTSVAEIGAGAGFDWLLIDAEHAPFDIKSIMHHLQAIEPHGVPAIVRPPEGSVAYIKKLLDVGAQSILVPMVETAEQAELMVRAAKYPPAGIRGLGTSMARAANWNRTPNYLQQANDEICVLIQVETKKGIENIEEIVQVEGLDGVFIGPSDLSAAMGHIGNPGHPEVVAAIETGFKVIQAAGKQAGVLAVEKPLVEKYIEAGAKFIGVGVDAALLANATRKLASEYIAEADSTTTKGY